VRYYFVEPEVPGGWGDNTIVLDHTVHPPIITKLEFEFDSLPEDVLMTSFPVYLLKRDAKPDLAAIRPTGVNFDKVRVTKSEEFRYFFPRHKLPEVVWLKIIGKAGHDDFGIAPAPDLRLVVSGRVMSLLMRFGISHATIEDYPLAEPDSVQSAAESRQPKYPVNPETGERMKVHEVVSIKGKKYIVRACNYATGKPQYLEADSPQDKRCDK